jgi:hypothetical protein
MKKSNHPTPLSRSEAGENNLLRKAKEKRYKSHVKKKTLKTEATHERQGLHQPRERKIQLISRCEKYNEKKINQREKEKEYIKRPEFI